MTTGHVIPLLGAYALGALDEQEVSTVQEHLASCPPCRQEAQDLRELTTALGAVPPEALLVEGPPPGGDLLLQRTLRQARAERARQRWRGRAAAGVAAVLAGAVILAGGAVLGRATAPQPEAA